MYINLNPALFLAKFKTGLNSRPVTIANPAKPFLFPVITILRTRFERPIVLVIIDIGLAYSIQLSNPSKVSEIEDIDNDNITNIYTNNMYIEYEYMY